MPKARILVQLSEDGVVVREYQRFAKSTTSDREKLMKDAMGQIQLWESVNIDNLWSRELEFAKGKQDSVPAPSVFHHVLR